VSEASIPKDVFLDTSVVVGAMFPGTPDADACSRFCRDLVVARSHVYFAQVLRLDLARALRRLATKADKLPPGMREEYQLDLWGTNPLVRQRWLTRGARRFDDFLSQFIESVELPLTTDLWRRGLTIMGVEGLDATDALHLAAARQIGIADFATTDRDFRQVADPRIHLIRDDATT
jgi:predicted nucleic acid-binding protein